MECLNKVFSTVIAFMRKKLGTGFRLAEEFGISLTGRKRKPLRNPTMVETRAQELQSSLNFLQSTAILKNPEIAEAIAVEKGLPKEIVSRAATINYSYGKQVVAVALTFLEKNNINKIPAHLQPGFARAIYSIILATREKMPESQETKKARQTVKNCVNRFLSKTKGDQDQKLLFLQSQYFQPTMIFRSHRKKQSV